MEKNINSQFSNSLGLSKMKGKGDKVVCLLFTLSKNNESDLSDSRVKKMDEMFNKPEKYLTTQYIGTYKIKVVTK